MLEIKVTDGANQSKTYRLDEPRLSIGRDADNDVVVPDRSCSRHHAEIVREDGVYRLRDLQSANGIYQGSNRVEDLVLSSGTSVSIGENTLTFTIEGRGPETVGRVLVYFARDGLKNLQIASGLEYVIGRSPTWISSWTTRAARSGTAWCSPRATPST